MSDPNKFINTYIDTAIATLHEYMGSSLQLKTQLKLANDLLIERDATIAQLISEKDAAVLQLTNELENVNTVFSNTQGDAESLKTALISCQDKLKIAEESHAAISSKVSHMDTLLKQLTDMKTEIKNRDDLIASLNNDLATKDTQLSSYSEKFNNLNSTLANKEKLISELTKKLEKLAPSPPAVSKPALEKTVKESSTVKVQLNTKTKTKEPDDDF